MVNKSVKRIAALEMKWLEHLDISDNEITNKGVKYICRADRPNLKKTDDAESKSKRSYLTVSVKDTSFKATDHIYFSLIRFSHYFP